jgi:beta-galactosidase
VKKALVLMALSLAAYGQKLNFDPDWKFIKADPPNAAAVDFNDGSWSNVSLPHTFNDVDTFDDWSNPNGAGETNLWAGRTWYRKTFTLPDTMRGKEIFIEFEAVRQVAEVYLNGKLLGVSKTGFIPFGFDITHGIRWDAKNVIAVMADNTFTQETVKTDLSWNSPRWLPAHGGIYRNVYLHVTDGLHITLPLFSFLQTAGPYVYATDISGQSARINMEVPIENDRGLPTNVEVVGQVLGSDGRLLAEWRAPGPMPPGGATTVKLGGVLGNPQLWEPAYPYLYTVALSLRVGGQIVDTQRIPFGIRGTRWDVNSGLYVNGHHLKLHGWAQPPTDEWPGLGAALPDWMHFFTLSLMKDAGGNFIRWAHGAGAPGALDAGDRLGIVASQPGVDGEGDAVGDAWSIRAAAWRDMVVYYRNHPSILIWEGGSQKISPDHAKELRGYLDQYDPHGGRVYAYRGADNATAEFMDIGIGTEGEKAIARLPVVEGEYDREESPRRVWDDYSPPNFGRPEGKGQTNDLTSEQYAVNQVTQYVSKLGAPDHSGGANWLFSDSTIGGRVSTEVASAAGEVDGVRLPKQAYYVCQTMFRDDPQVYIVGHWTYPAGTKKTVYVTSNAEEVELFINGKSLGRGKPKDRYLFTFPDVTWQPGEIKAVAYNNGQSVATSSKQTAGEPAALKMTPIAAPGGWRADGSDVLLIDVEAVDAKGERCPTFQQRVDFEISGPGVWRGGYNSGKIKSTNNTYLDLEAGINRVAIRSTRTAGAVTVSAKGANLQSASLTVSSNAIPVQNGYSVLMPAMQTVTAVRRAGLGAMAGPIPLSPAASPVGQYITSFSYSGPATGVHVEPNAAPGKRVYVDGGPPFGALPPDLVGADYVESALMDQLYITVNLMEVAVKAGSTITIAHDDRIPPPSWLGQFQTTARSIIVGGVPMHLYQRRADRAESVTLGLNGDRGGYMYIVFVK